jgi:hypothetical protein
MQLPRGKHIPKLFAQRKGKKINEQHLELNGVRGLSLHLPFSNPD